MKGPEPRTENRFRLRNAALKDPEFGTRLADKIKSLHGVLSVTLNDRLGSMLVIYDTMKTDMNTITGRISAHQGLDCSRWLKKRKPAARETRKLVKIGLIGGIGGTLGTLAVSGRTHALAGTIFLGLLAIHSYQHRRTLLT